MDTCRSCLLHLNVCDVNFRDSMVLMLPLPAFNALSSIHPAAVLNMDNAVVDLETLQALYENVSIKKNGRCHSRYEILKS